MVLELFLLPHNRAQTTQPPQHCQNHQVAKRWSTPCLVNHIFCGCECAGESWQPTPSWICKLLSFEGPTVKHLVGAQWLGFLANEDDSKANKQVWRVSPNVLWWLCDGQGGRPKRREGELRKTGRDNMGGKTGSVDRGEEWLGGMEQNGTESMR